MIYFIILFVSSICIGVGVMLILFQKASTKKEESYKILQAYMDTLSGEALETFSNLTIQQQIQVMNMVYEAMTNQQQQILAQKMNFQQEELHRLMSTGIEFGGFNTDLGLNPSMQMEQQHQMDMTSHMNNDNFGGPGTF